MAPTEAPFDIEFFWDPVCPFAWITSRWVVKVAQQSEHRVDWRFISLRLLNKPEPGTAFLVESFGFKRRMPVDADLVFDVRCLPNPYWKPELREHSGLEQPVIDYLAAQPDVEDMFNDISSYLLKWLPRFAASNRAYVTIAIGCTGGHHRSVYLTERLGTLLQQSLKNVQVRHRAL